MVLMQLSSSYSFVFLHLKLFSWNQCSTLHWESVSLKHMLCAVYFCLSTTMLLYLHWSRWDFRSFICNLYTICIRKFAARWVWHSLEKRKATMEAVPVRVDWISCFRVVYMFSLLLITIHLVWLQLVFSFYFVHKTSLMPMLWINVKHRMGRFIHQLPQPPCQLCQNPIIEPAKHKSKEITGLGGLMIDWFIGLDLGGDAIPGAQDKP